MADRLHTEQRPERMSRVRQHGTSIELLVRKALHRQGLRFRLGGSDLPGRVVCTTPAHSGTMVSAARLPLYSGPKWTGRTWSASWPR